MTLPDPRITRREATGLVLGAMALPAAAHAATPAALRAQPVKSPLDDIMFRERMQNWTLKVQVHLQAYYQQSGGTIVSTPFDVKEGTFVFPVLRHTASSWVNTDDLTSDLRWNDRVVATEPTAIVDHSGSRFGLWRFSDKKGREADLRLQIPMLTWETWFDEKAANEVPWPTEAWGPNALSTFSPQYAIDYTSQPVQDLVKKWTQGKDPKSIKPVVLAKFFAQQAVEMFQPSGNGTLADRDTLKLQGFDMQSASTTIERERGSRHDIAAALVALYRAAGLPARPVIAWDLRESKGEDRGLRRSGGSGDLKSWVEFCLYDPKAQRELWIPVDIDRIRSKSSRAPKLDRTWDYFGTHDELDDALPFAHHYHPPIAGVVAHGSPMCWGWYTSPRTQIADQWLDFQSQKTPRRSNDPVDTGDFELPPEKNKRRR